MALEITHSEVIPKPSHSTPIVQQRIYQQLQYSTLVDFIATPPFAIEFLLSSLKLDYCLCSNCRMGKGDDVRQLLAMRLYHFVSNVVQPPVTFKLFPIGEQLSPHYRLATIQDVHDHRNACLRAMPLWESANLEDGSVYGARFGGETR